MKVLEIDTFIKKSATTMQAPPIVVYDANLYSNMCWMCSRNSLCTWMLWKVRLDRAHFSPCERKLSLVTLYLISVRVMCNYCMHRVTKMLIYYVSLTRIYLLVYDVATRITCTWKERPCCIVEVVQSQHFVSASKEWKKGERDKDSSLHP